MSPNSKSSPAAASPYLYKMRARSRTICRGGTLRALLLALASVAGTPGCHDVAEVLTPPPVGTSAGGATGSSGDNIGMTSGGGAPAATQGTGGVTATSTAGAPGAALVMVDAGNDHSCAVVQGALYCWGGNQRGRLGVGDGQNRILPTQVGVLRSWTQVTTAADHSCALREEGSVWCFGANDMGQLGLPGVNDVLTPIAVTLPTSARLITSENAFTCALLDSGRIVCWGQNSEGMLAQNDSYPGEDQFLPVPVTDLDDWSSVDAGNGHACALRQPGTLWCWGRNSGDQLGLGPDAAVQFRYPEQVGNANDWIQVQAGQDHSCALRQGGALWCWGENEFGNLGTGDRELRESPVRIDTHQYSQVSLDTFHTCAVDTATDLWCWGRNVEGQLGLGDTADRVLPTKVTGGGWEQVAVGRFHTCATKLDDSLWCTGENAVGQLGVGDTERRNEFTRLGLPAP